MSERNVAPHLCECGCGKPTKIATETNTLTGSICGLPRQFAAGHNPKGAKQRRVLFVAVGDRFGHGVVIKTGLRIPQAGRQLTSGKRAAYLLCDCGTMYIAPLGHLLRGQIRSCGCLQRDVQRELSTTHGMALHSLYRTWRGMIARCTDPQHHSYPNYGGRGITVCTRWLDPRPFVIDIERDLGPRPKGWTLDRINNDGNYEPGNVRWASAAMQQANRRPSSRSRTERRETGRRAWGNRPTVAQVCEHCGSEYEAKAGTGSRFCSRACKCAFRRVSGMDDVERICHQCGSAFIRNKHDKIRHCSQSCATKCQHSGGCPG